MKDGANFGFNSAALPPQARKEIDGFLSDLKGDLAGGENAVFLVAGHTDNGTHCIDTHDGRVVDAVWDLYRCFHERAGPRATLLEWDANIPKFSVLQQEVRKAARFRGAAGRAAA
jgi:hypothetical protein